MEKVLLINCSGIIPHLFVSTFVRKQIRGICMDSIRSRLARASAALESPRMPDGSRWDVGTRI